MTPERIARLRYVLDRRQPDLTVVTDFVHKPRNLSAVVRSCDAAGVMQVHAVLGGDDYRAFRGTAMGSQRWVEVCGSASVEAAIEPLQSSGYQIVGAHLDAQSIDYREVDYTRPTAIVLGAEGRGLGENMQAMADSLVSIPMVGMVGSLNVSVAAGVILAEAQQQRQAAGLYDSPRIDHAQYQRLFFEWGHPQVREYCLSRGLQYPALNEEGEIDNPSGWYASVRAGTAPMATAESSADTSVQARKVED